MMAEAWIQEEEEEKEVRGVSDRDPGFRHRSAAARRTGASLADRSDRNKPDQASRNSSHGPLSTIKAAIRRTSSRASSQSEQRRERRRPAITVLSAEPIGPSSWYPGVPGNCAAPVRVGAPYPRTLWSIDEPTAAEPPPSYEQVIREISQQPGPTPPVIRHSTATISTQTEFDEDTEDLETRSADADFACLTETLPVTDPFQTLPRGQAPPTDVIPSRPPLSRKPTVIRIPNKPSKTSPEDIASPPPLPAVTPVGNFIAERPKTVSTENCDLPGPVANQPLVKVGKVPPARPAPVKAGPARPPPPKVSAVPNQFRRSSSELKINSTVGKRSPSIAGKARPKSQVFQKKGPELPPRPAPGHPLYNKYMLPVPHGIAECNITSKVPGELSFQQGDILVLKQHIDQSFDCQKGFDTGKVASSHLKIITPLEEDEVKGTSKKSVASDLQFGNSNAPRALVLHDFTADQNDELNLKAGDTVYLLKKLDKDWYSGKCKGHTGIFPANFVKVLVDLPVGDSKETSVKKDLFKSAPPTKGPRCVARFDFEGDQPDELTFFEGDVIALKEYVNEEWAQGELKDRTGIFPLNFVDLIENLPTSEQKPVQNSPMPPGSNSVTGERAIETSTSNQVGDLDLQWCEALYDFKAEAADDLPFKRGDRILILEQIDSEWCKGKLNGIEGIFPSAFVQICTGTTSPVKQQSSEDKRGMAKALYNFVGDNEDELNFKVGDTIILLESIDADWLKGELQGKEGIFPRSFVQVLKDPL
ncbi:SH3 domain-containing protein 19 isoform X3 [Hemitrygon akajei]|uniref:SH3 domain-containing protein 19 isoform X3 n=1 Tax=Hemitrygon akajei TaxID=2704970 RepID=UPI003BFA2008